MAGMCFSLVAGVPCSFPSPLGQASCSSLQGRTTLAVMALGGLASSASHLVFIQDSRNCSWALHEPGWSSPSSPGLDLSCFPGQTLRDDRCFVRRLGSSPA